MFYFQVVVLILMITSATYMAGSVLVGLTDGIPNVTLYTVALTVFIVCVVIYFLISIIHGNAILWR